MKVFAIVRLKCGLALCVVLLVGCITLSPTGGGGSASAYMTNPGSRTPQAVFYVNGPDPYPFVRSINSAVRAGATCQLIVRDALTGEDVHRATFVRAQAPGSGNRIQHQIAVGEDLRPNWRKTPGNYYLELLVDGVQYSKFDFQILP